LAILEGAGLSLGDAPPTHTPEVPAFSVRPL
jgi:hypothetical protein